MKAIRPTKSSQWHQEYREELAKLTAIGGSTIRPTQSSQWHREYRDELAKLTATGGSTNERSTRHAFERYLKRH